MEQTKKHRPLREDGAETREKLLVCAGRIIAQKGFDRTTSKEICSLAGVNSAAVNYHFGSRENLYRELLLKVHRETFPSADMLRKLAGTDCSAQDKLLNIVNILLAMIVNADGWLIRVWIREISNPSDVLSEIAMTLGKEKIAVAKEIFAEYTGRSANDPAIYSCMAAFVSPFATMLFAHNNTIDYQGLSNHSQSIAQFQDDIKKFIFAGLDAFKV